MSRLIDADALIADCQLAQKQADRHGREFANAFYSDGGEISTEWWCVEDMIENAPTIEPQIMRGRWIEDGYNDEKAVCDQCGEPCATYIMGKPRDKYCKWCGADMRETE